MFIVKTHLVQHICTRFSHCRWLHSFCLAWLLDLANSCLMFWLIEFVFLICVLPTIYNPICQLLIQVLLIENGQQTFLFPVLNFVLLCLNWVCTYSRPTEAAQFQFQGSSISILVFREELYFYSHLLRNFYFWKITEEKAMLTFHWINFRGLEKRFCGPSYTSVYCPSISSVYRAFRGGHCPEICTHIDVLTPLPGSYWLQKIYALGVIVAYPIPGHQR